MNAAHAVNTGEMEFASNAPGALNTGNVVDAAAPQDASHEVAVGRGNLYLSRELCDACLPGIQSVALLLRGRDVMIVPLTGTSAGGLLLKQRNARGDRVIHAQEFFRSRNLPEEAELRMLPARWDTGSAALIVSGLAAG